MVFLIAAVCLYCGEPEGTSDTVMTGFMIGFFCMVVLVSMIGYVVSLFSKDRTSPRVVTVILDDVNRADESQQVGVGTNSNTELTDTMPDDNVPTSVPRGIPACAHFVLIEMQGWLIAWVLSITNAMELGVSQCDFFLFTCNWDFALAFVPATQALTAVLSLFFLTPLTLGLGYLCYHRLLFENMGSGR